MDQKTFCQKFLNSQNYAIIYAHDKKKDLKNLL